MGQTEAPAKQFSCLRMDRLIWDILEAELLAACDNVVRTRAHVKVIFTSQSIRRVFYPERFVGLCRHGGATPFVHHYVDNSYCGVLFAENTPFVVVFRKNFCAVRLSFSYIFVKESGMTFHNA